MYTTIPNFSWNQNISDGRYCNNKHFILKNRHVWYMPPLKSEGLILFGTKRSHWQDHKRLKSGRSRELLTCLQTYDSFWLRDDVINIEWFPVWTGWMYSRQHVNGLSCDRDAVVLLINRPVTPLHNGITRLRQQWMFYQRFCDRCCVGFLWRTVDVQLQTTVTKRNLLFLWCKPSEIRSVRLLMI